MRFQVSLPVRLAILVAGTMLPLIIFSGAVIYSNYLQDRSDAQDRVISQTRSVRQLLDREIQGMVSGLKVLANSRSLAVDDFEAFRLNAKAFVEQFPDHPSISIGDQSGQQLFNSSVPTGEALPPRTDRPERDIVFRSGQPAFSPLFIGSVSKVPIVTISVPVFRDGKVKYDVSFNPPLQIFQQIIEQQWPGEDWTMSIFDQTGINIARLPNPDRTIGQRAAPQLFQRLFLAPESQFPTVSREQVHLLTAVSRSEITGWIAVSGIAESTLTAPALQNLFIALLIGGLLLLVGLSFALHMAAHIARGEALQVLLINELNHRVKNTLSTVQSLATQTFRHVPDAEAKRKFGSRLAALGGAHDLLSDQKWEGADIREVLETVLNPYESGGSQVILSGPPIRMSARCVTMFSMVINELATNATKYGALSVPEGRVRIEWQETGNDGQQITLRWREIRGPAVDKPVRVGFGSALIEQGFAAQLGGKAELLFERDGLVCTMECPLD